MFKVKKILLFFLLIVSDFVFCQDIHFSQFYRAPLSLNPALTGNIDGNLRAILNHRNQWNSIAVPYVTSSCSFDSKLLEDRLKGDAVGAGLIIINDRSGEGHLNNFQMMLNASYSKKLDLKKEHSISIGLQAGFFQKKIDYTKLSFESQYFAGDFNTSIQSGENTLNFSKSNFDMSSGISYQLQKPDNLDINMGFSIHHITKPNESLSGTIARMPLLFGFYFNARKVLNEKINLRPDLLFATQNKAKELNIGGRLEYIFKTISGNSLNFTVGAAYRTSDAIIVITGINYEKWDVCVSYDINNSKLHPATNYNGGFEISIIYTDKFLSGKNKIPFSIPCIRL
ncbi:MAG: PorP/SprF family type IX secretion system membrane protein [Bacteroidales bacterium]|nr:PorP/SprF family type IX secretion system membrane protein [Bacteroidales bacterium]